MLRLVCVVAVIGGCNDPSPPCFAACEGTADAAVIDAPPPPPALVSFEPARGATGVKTTDSVTVAFAVPVQNVNEKTFHLSSNGVPIDGVVFFTAERTAAVFVPEHLPSHAIVEGSLDPSITTVDSDISIGIQLWSFATEVDNTPPTIATFAPGDGAANIPVSAGVGFTFDEDVANTSWIRITANGVPVPGTWDHETGANVHASVFQPTAQQLPAHATIEVSVAAPVCDYAGNSIVPFDASFTTGPDTVPAHLIATVPKEGAVDVPTDQTIQFVFDEPVAVADPPGIVIVVDWAYPIPATTAVSGEMVTVTAAFPPSSEIAIYTEGVTDLAGNVSDYELDFTTK